MIMGPRMLMRTVTIMPDEEDVAVSNAAAHEDDAADHTVVAAPDGHDAHEHGEYDPHVWLDPMNAKQEMQNICEAFSEADPEHRADYQANYEKWAKQLDELDKTYQTTLENLSERNIVVAHEAYGYLCRRYNLTQVSIEGMSPDSEPTRDGWQILSILSGQTTSVRFSLKSCPARGRRKR